MNFQRLTNHLLMTHWHVHRAFPRDALIAIEDAIKAGETEHGGQIRFAVEGALDTVPLIRDQTAKARAVEVFSQLRIWDTEHNNGVLIYLLLADRDVEIVADRGIHQKVGPAEWERICRKMEMQFKERRYAEGVIAGIRAVTTHLTERYPVTKAGPNELPDKALVL